jgi:predicted RNA-binding protein YlxR (DUF448 family)
MPKCHFDGFNLWLLKPTHLNRGRGIHVFIDLDTLNQLIKEYCSGKELDNHKRKAAEEGMKEVEEEASAEERPDERKE